MKNFNLRLEGPSSYGEGSSDFGEDAFMDLVADRLKCEYSFVKKDVYNTTKSRGIEKVGHVWEVKQKVDIYSISKSTGVSTPIVERVIHALEEEENA